MSKSWSIAVCTAILGLALCCPSCSTERPAAGPSVPARSEVATPPQPTASPSTPAPAPVAAPARPVQEPNVPKPVASTPTPTSTPVATPAPVAAAQPAIMDPNVVATIGDSTITGEDFRRRCVQEMQPNPYSGNPIRPAPELKAVALEMLGEKAIILDAQQRGVDKKEDIQVPLKRERELRIVRKLITAVVAPQVVVSDQDVNSLMAKDPNLPRERARALVYNQRGNEALSKYYRQLMLDRHLKKVTENFPQAAAIYNRLSSMPKPESKKNIFWIENDQVRNNIDPNEKALVLATFDGGMFTVKDFFDALCDIAPPGRPKNLDTVQGVEGFLDRVVSRPVLAVEAVAKGYDKDPEVVRMLRRMEDDMLLGTVRMEKVAGVAEPNQQEVAAAYDKVKDTYGKNDSLKVDVIWCENRQAAAKAEADLDAGKDFKAVQTQYSAQTPKPAGAPGGPADDYMGQEGLFWPDLWKAEPNQVVGPILGFRAGTLAWRVVKVLGKKEGKPAPSENAMNMIKGELREQRQKAVMDKTAAELLAKFPHQINEDRLAVFDPRNVP